MEEEVDRNMGWKGGSMALVLGPMWLLFGPGIITTVDGTLL